MPSGTFARRWPAWSALALLAACTTAPAPSPSTSSASPTTTTTATASDSVTASGSASATDPSATVTATTGGPTATGSVTAAPTVALPTAKLRYIEQTRMSDTGGTILAYIRGNRDGGDNINFVPIRELAGAGASGTDRLVAYDASQEVVQFHLPGDHEFLPAFQKSSMTYEVGGIMNVGGTEVRLPKAITYRDGI